MYKQLIRIFITVYHDNVRFTVHQISGLALTASGQESGEKHWVHLDILKIRKHQQLSYSTPSNVLIFFLN